MALYYVINIRKVCFMHFTHDISMYMISIGLDGLKAYLLIEDF